MIAAEYRRTEVEHEMRVRSDNEEEFDLENDNGNEPRDIPLIK